MASKLNPSTGETQEETLKRLASTRVSKALEQIRIVGNIGSYKPTAEQTKKVFAELEKAMQEAKAAWTSGKPAKGTGFQL